MPQRENKVLKGKRGSDAKQVNKTRI